MDGKHTLYTSDLLPPRIEPFEVQRLSAGVVQW